MRHLAKLSQAQTKLLQLPSAVTSEDPAFCFASATGSFVCLFLFFKGTLQRVKYTVFEGMVNALGVPVGTSGKLSPTLTGTA